MESFRKASTDQEEVLRTIETWPLSGDKDSGLPSFPATANKVWRYLFRQTGGRVNVSVRVAVGGIMDATGIGERTVRKQLYKLEEPSKHCKTGLALISIVDRFNGQLTIFLRDPRPLRRARIVSAPDEDQAELPFVPAPPHGADQEENTPPDSPALPESPKRWQQPAALRAHEGPAIYVPERAHKGPSPLPNSALDSDGEALAQTALLAHKGPDQTSLKSLREDKNKDPMRARASREDLRETALLAHEGLTADVEKRITAGLEPSPEISAELERCRRNSAKEEGLPTIGNAVDERLRRFPTESEKADMVKDLTAHILDKVKDNLYPAVAKKVAWEIVNAGFDRQKLEDVLDQLQKNRATGNLGDAGPRGYFVGTMKKLFERDGRLWHNSQNPRNPNAGPAPKTEGPP